MSNTGALFPTNIWTPIVQDYSKVQTGEANLYPLKSYQRSFNQTL